MNPRIVYIIIPLIVFISSFLVYLPSLKNSFVWDDQILIDRSYKKFKNVDFGKLFFPEEKKSGKGVYYRPVIRTSLTADYTLWKKNSFGYHLTNNLFYSFTVTAFYFLALFIFRRFRKEEDMVFPVFAATTIFLLHPIHVETVSWIVGRTDLICGFFIVLALLAHIRSSRNLFLFTAPLFFILSVMSKEVAVAFPFIAVFYDILARRFRMRNIFLLVVYFLILSLYIFMRTRSFTNTASIKLSSVSGNNPSPEITEGLFNILEPAKVVICSMGIYIEKLLLPINLNAYIPYVPTDPVYLIPSIFLIAAVAGAFILGLIKKQYILTLSIFITIITLGPSLILSIMPIAATPVAERYLFIPSIGYALFIGYLFLMLRKKIGLIISLLLLTAVSAFFLYTNLDRQAVWRDSRSLWSETSKNSVYAFTHANHALALEEYGDDEKTLNAYAVALSPDFIDTDHGRAITANNLALFYIQREEYQKAENTLKRALSLSPEYNRTYYNLGLINYIKGEVTGSDEAYKKALGYVNRAMAYYSRNPKLKLLKAKILLKLGEVKTAIEEIDKAISSGLEGELLIEAEAIKKIYKDTGDNKPGNNTQK